MQKTLRTNLIKQVLDSLHKEGTIWTSGVDKGRSPLIFDAKTRTFVEPTERIEASSVLSVINNANTHQYSSQVWITQSDAKSLGIYFIKGTRGTPVIDNAGKKVYLFNVNQLDIKKEHFLNNDINVHNPEIEGVIRTCGFSFQNTDSTPYYDAANKVIYMPERSRFTDDDLYYTSVMHEIAHATHEVLRGPVMERNADPDSYAKAELEAELTALSYAAANGLGFKCQENSLAFIKTWLEGYGTEEQTIMLNEVMDNVDENIEFLEDRSMDVALKERDAYTLEKNGKVYLNVNSRQDFYRVSELGAFFDEHHQPYIVEGQDISLFAKFLSKKEEEVQKTSTVTTSDVEDKREELEAKNAVNSNSPNVDSNNEEEQQEVTEIVTDNSEENIVESEGRPIIIKPTFVGHVNVNKYDNVLDYSFLAYTTTYYAEDVEEIIPIERANRMENKFVLQREQFTPEHIYDLVSKQMQLTGIQLTRSLQEELKDSIFAEVKDQQAKLEKQDDESIIGDYSDSDIENSQSDSIQEEFAQIDENNLEEQQEQVYTLDEFNNTTVNSIGNTDSYSQGGNNYERGNTAANGHGTLGGEGVSNGSSGEAESIPQEIGQHGANPSSNVLRQGRTNASATKVSSGDSTREVGGRSGSSTDRGEMDTQTGSKLHSERTNSDLFDKKMSSVSDDISEHKRGWGTDITLGSGREVSEDIESRGTRTAQERGRDSNSVLGGNDLFESAGRSSDVGGSDQHHGGHLSEQAIESIDRETTISESRLPRDTSRSSDRLHMRQSGISSDSAPSSNSSTERQRSVHEVSQGTDTTRGLNGSGDASSRETIAEGMGSVGISSSEVPSREHAVGSESNAQGRDSSGLLRGGRSNSDRDVRDVSEQSDEQRGMSVEEQDSRVASVLQHVENVSGGIYILGIHQSSRLNKDLLSGVPSDFVIKDPELGVGSEEVRFQNNINAIKTLKTLESDKRWPSPEEQETLSKYVGWGGLANAFDERKEKWAARYQELKDLLDPKEYQSAKESIFNAFYTQPEIVANIHNILGSMNADGQPLSVLEPSCGVGNFLGAMPQNLASSKTGVELDSVSGRIASFLYPSSDIVITDFKDFASARKFDAVVGNVPFSSMVIDDKNYRGQMVVDEHGNGEKLKLNLHNYFMTKGLDMARPGGVVTLITSSSTLDGNNEVVRRNLAQMGNFIGAIRLPNNAFKGAAGTNVVSDIIFIQKRDVRAFNVRDQDWIRTEQSDLDGDIFINSYFNKHPEMVLGTQEVTTNQFGKKVLTVKPFEDKTLSEAIEEASISIVHSENLSDSFIHPAPIEEEEGTIAIPGIVDSDIGTIKVYNGKAYEVFSDVQATDLNLNDLQIAKLAKFEDLVSSYHKVIDLQLNDCSDDELTDAQKELKACYDNFTRGSNSKNPVLINSSANAFLRKDYRYNAMSALEDVDEKRKLLSLADVFTKRTVGAKVVPVIETPEDAMYTSVLTTGGADFELMEGLLNGKYTKAEIMEEIGERLFRDPKLVKAGDDDYTGWVDSESYLSGNIAAKLKLAQDSAAQDSGYERNVEALKAIMPPRIGLSEINFNMGSPFIDVNIVQTFLQEKFGDGVNVQYGGGDWSVEVKRGYVPAQQRENREAVTKLSEDRGIGLEYILESTLNLKAPKIFDKVPKPGVPGETIDKINEHLTTMAVAKTIELEDEFKDYILGYENAQASNQIEQSYNDRYNSIVNRKFDGSKLAFDGMSNTIQLRPHQKDAVARTMFGGNTLMAHEVGAGKTFAMIAAAMEGKRLGLHNKSLIAVPNAVHEQWVQDIQKLYPQAKVLTLDLSSEGTTVKKRNTMMAKIANGSYDIVLVTHDQLGKMSLSPEAFKAFIDEQKKRLEVIALGAGKSTQKRIMEKIKDLERRLTKRMAEDKDKSGLNFESLGIDKIFVDEAHAFKNLCEATLHDDLAGVTQRSAIRSLDFLSVTNYMNEKYGDTRIVLATGTPVSNNLTEFYTMMRYLSPSLLKEHNLDYLDSFISGFGHVTQGFEFDSVGEWQLKSRLSMFNNVPEMMNMYQSTADVITVDTLGFKLPTPHTHVVACETTPEQDEALQGLRERAERVRGKQVDKKVDNMLKITSAGRHLALDQRMYNPALGPGKGSKVDKVCDNVKRIYDADPTNKDTQMIFSDLGCPGNEKFSVYQAIREELVARGIPENEIAFIQEHNTKGKKKQLMKAVNEGKVRVLLGSTSTVGTGVNCQKLLKAVHHIDVPWRPSDMTQRNGRIVRQGNTHSDVDIYQYVTKGTYDMVMYEKLMTKQKFVHQVMHYKDQEVHGRTMQAVDDNEQLSFEEAMASSAKDRRVLDKATFDREYNMVAAERKSFFMRRTSAERKLKGLPVQISEAQKVSERWNNISQVAKTKLLIDKDTLKVKLEYFAKNMNRNTWSSTQELELGEYKGGHLNIHAHKDPSVENKWRVKFVFGSGNTGINLKDAFELNLRMGTKPDYWFKTLESELDGLIDNRANDKAQFVEELKNDQERLTKTLEQPAIFKKEEDFQRLTKLRNELEKTLPIPTDAFEELTSDYRSYMIWKLGSSTENSYIDLCMQESLDQGTAINRDWKPEDELKEKQAAQLNPQTEAQSETPEVEKADKLFRLSKADYMRTIETNPTSKEEVEEAKQDGFVQSKGKFIQHIPERLVEEARKKVRESFSAKQKTESNDVNIRYYPGKDFNLSKIEEKFKPFVMYDHDRDEWFCIASAKNMKPIEEFIKSLPHAASRREALQNELDKKGLGITIKRSALEKSMQGAGKMLGFAVKEVGHVVKEVSVNTVAKYLKRKERKQEEQESQQDKAKIAEKLYRLPNPNAKIYLNVPFIEKDEAKALGAHWDKNASQWYATSQNIDKLSKWTKEEPQADNGLETIEDSIDAMIKDMRANGMIINRNELQMDGSGTITGRCRCEGEHDQSHKHNSGAGWYVIHLDGCPTLSMENHRTGNLESKKYPNKESISRWKQNRQNATAMRKSANAQVVTQTWQQEATKEANFNLKQNSHDPERVAQVGNKVKEQIQTYHANKTIYPESQYLAKKGLDMTQDAAAFMLKSGGQFYTCFAFSNIEGQITTKQYVNSNGDKRFETGGQKSGSFHVINGFKQLKENTAPIVIAEGVATAMSIQSAVERDAVVVAAGDCGNLANVAQALHAKFPQRKIVLAADNDHKRTDNVGLIAAEEAAKSVGGTVVSPVFAQGEKGTDFNDLMVSKGKKAVADIVRVQLAKVTKKKSHSR